MGANQAPTDANVAGEWDEFPRADTPSPPPGFVLDQPPAPQRAPSPSPGGNWWEVAPLADHPAPQKTNGASIKDWAADNAIYLIPIVLLCCLFAIFIRRNRHGESSISTGFRRVGIVLAAIPAFIAVFPIMISATGNMSSSEAALFVTLLFAASIVLYALSRAIGWIVLGFRHE